MTDLRNVRTLAVIGSGIMGSGITEAALLAGFDRVVLNDIDSDALKKGHSAVTSMIRTIADEDSFSRLVTSYRGMNSQTGPPEIAKLRQDPKIAGVISQGKTADEILRTLVCEPDLRKAVSEADFVIEAVAEILGVKQELFRKLSELTPEHTVCASNTSTIPISKIVLASKRPKNAIGMHFHGNFQVFNRLVEIMGSDKTCEDAMELGRQVGASIPSLGGERLAVRLDKEAAGFIANRIAAPASLYGAWFLNRAMEEGITFEQLHAAGYDMRGADVVGLDTAYNAAISYRQHLSPYFGPTKMVTDLVKQGKLGRKTGQGFYQWDASGNAVIKKVEVEEKTRDFFRKHRDPELALASRMNEGCRLIEMGVVKGYGVINDVERIGESHEATFAVGMDKYEEWGEKLEAVAEKIGKPYLKPCEMMMSGRFRDHP